MYFEDVLVAVLKEEQFRVKQIQPNQMNKFIFDKDLFFFFVRFTSLFHVAETFRIDGLSVVTSVEVFFIPVASSIDED